MSDDVVEIDAVDMVEWDRDRHTPQASDQKVAELVKKSAETDKPAEVARPTAAHARTTTRPRAAVVPAIVPPKTVAKATTTTPAAPIPVVPAKTNAHMVKAKPLPALVR